MARVQTHASIARDILSRASHGSRLVAVDGPGGAGKTFFAARLSAALSGAPIVHTDDFATGEPGDEWWSRLHSQVLDPLLHSDPARFQRYDWHRRTLAEWHEVPPSPAVVIEGVSSARREVAALTISVWVFAPRAVRLRRASIATVSPPAVGGTAGWPRRMRTSAQTGRSHAARSSSTDLLRSPTTRGGSLSGSTPAPTTRADLARREPAAAGSDLTRSGAEDSKKGERRCLPTR